MFRLERELRIATVFILSGPHQSVADVETTESQCDFCLGFINISVAPARTSVIYTPAVPATSSPFRVGCHMLVDAKR